VRTSREDEDHERGDDEAKSTAMTTFARRVYLAGRGVADVAALLSDKAWFEAQALALRRPHQRLQFSWRGFREVVRNPDHRRPHPAGGRPDPWGEVLLPRKTLRAVPECFRERPARWVRTHHRHRRWANELAGTELGLRCD
jgi:hypothetical protein